MRPDVMLGNADAKAPGAEGLIALETFQRSRTPVTDSKAREEQ